MASATQPVTKRDIRYERFALEYLKDLNGREAAKRAGYAENSAHSASTRLLANPKVIALIERFREKLRERGLVDIEKVRKELCKMAFANAGDYYTVDEDGSPHIDLSGLDEYQTAAIQSIDVKEYTEGRAGKAGVDEDGNPTKSKQRVVKETKIRLTSKHGALELLGKHLAMFKEVVEVEVHDKRAQMLADARARVHPQLPAGTDIQEAPEEQKATRKPN